MCVTRNLWGHSDKHFIYCTRKKGPAGRNFGFLLLEKLKNCILNEKLNLFFFSMRIFIQGHWITHRTAGDGRGPFFIPLYHFHSLHLSPALHLRWLSHIFNPTAFIYDIATRWDLPPYRIIIWMIDDVCSLLFVCLLIWF